LLFPVQIGLISVFAEGGIRPSPGETDVLLPIVGKVTGSDGSPLVGVSIIEKGTSNGTSSKEDGSFQINVKDKNAILTFSAVGYISQDISVGGSSPLNIILIPKDEEAEQVVVVGYGTMRRKDLTGSVNSLRTADVENENPKSVQDILRGNIPGLNIGMSTTAKSGGSIEIRGRRTLKATSSPLIVLDGVIYNGDLADINPSDIETIDVLKDASSAAVFGSKSANGVVIINTKTGKTGKPTIGLNVNTGISKLFRSENVYGPYEFINWRSDVLRSINKNAPYYVFNDPDKLPDTVTLAQWLAYDNSQGTPSDIWLRRIGLSQVERDNYNRGQSTDWKDMVFRTGFNQGYNLDLSGKSDKVGYYWSLGYDNNQGVVVKDDYRVYRSRFRLNADVTKYLSVGFNTLFSIRKESGGAVNWQMFDNISPWGQPTNPDGSLKIYPTDDAIAAKHPLIDRLFSTRDYSYRTLDNTLFAKLVLPFGITYELNYSPRFYSTELYLHNSSEHPEYARDGGTATRNTSNLFSWQVDNILKWRKTFNSRHLFDVTLLANAEKNQSWQQTMTGKQFAPSDVLGYHDVGAATIPLISSNDTYSTGDAYMARLFYSFNSKYLFTGTVRQDGYSAFGIENPRATFPSVALGYVFTEESFIKFKWLQYGKIRASFGENGNRSVGIYDALSTFSNNMVTYVDNKGNVFQEASLYANRMGNRQLRWEKTAALNFGLDFTIFDQVLTGSLDYYSMNTKDLLVDRSLPSVTGYRSVASNLGKINNKGFEVMLDSRNLETKNLLWKTTFNFSLNRNKIVSLYGNMIDVYDDKGNIISRREADDISNGWFINHAIDEIWDYRVSGVWQTGEEEEAAKYKLAPGDFRLEDKNGDYKFTNDDKSFLGFTAPRFRWTLRNEFVLFKKIDLSFSVYSLWGQFRSFNVAKHNPTMTLERFNSFKLPYWTKEHPRNDYARLNSNMAGVTFTVWRELSFVRLDNISLGYSLPEAFTEKIGISRAKVTLAARNVALWTKNYVFWDPEYNGPTPSYVNFGLRLTF
jgi:TonB-linked SusC/RagA family outer membrane protein